MIVNEHGVGGFSIVKANVMVLSASAGSFKRSDSEIARIFRILDGFGRLDRADDAMKG